MEGRHTLIVCTGKYTLPPASAIQELDPDFNGSREEAKLTSAHRIHKPDLRSNKRSQSHSHLRSFHIAKLSHSSPRLPTLSTHQRNNLILD